VKNCIHKSYQTSRVIYCNDFISRGFLFENVLHVSEHQFVTFPKRCAKYEPSLRHNSGWIVLPTLVSFSRQALDALLTHIPCFVTVRKNRRCEQKCKPINRREKLHEACADALNKTMRIISLRGRARINFASKYAARSQGIAMSDDAHRRRRQFYSLLLIHSVQKTRRSPISHCSFISDVNELITARGRVANSLA